MIINMNKKGGMFWKLMSLVLGLIGLIVIISIFFPQLFDFGDLFRTQATGLKTDSDDDGLVNLIQDKCPCTYADTANGCPEDYSPAQIADDKKKYDTDTAECTDLTGPPGSTEPEEIREEQAFAHYRSIEIFGDDDNENKRISGVIEQACTGMVGRECPSQNNDCDDDEYNYAILRDECWVMASEWDTGTRAPNDCGQAKVQAGTIISENTASELDISGNYISLDDENDPKNLFSWKWKSQSQYGSLICNKGFWFGCKGQEDKTLTVNDEVYTCKDNEWVKNPTDE
jgi:hypothetical protein